jgi:pimeloyl-ACP methyl ester carboxylesterase
MPAAKQPAPPNRPAPAHNQTLEVVDPVWLIKALVLTFSAAFLCAWLTACLLVYQGEWQSVLHPSHTIDRTPASVDLAYTEVRFDASETGQPRLTAWSIPATSPSPAGLGFRPRYAALTILYLHDGSGSLSATVPMLARLHAAGLSIFAIDYRGFGASDASVHPSADRMDQDAVAAVDYLTSTLYIPASSIIPYGVGLGASIAANLVHTRSGLPAVILDNPDPDPAAAAVAAHPSKIVPVRLLFGDQFNIAEPLANLATPKLLIAGGPNSPSAPREPGPMQALFQRAASPRFAVTLPPNADDQYQTVLRRFLDQIGVFQAQGMASPTQGLR